MERAVILADGDRLLPRHLSLMTQMGATADPWEMLDWSGSLADVAARFAVEAEKRKIALALKQAGGDAGRAADVLQINFKTLTVKLRQHCIQHNEVGRIFVNAFNRLAAVFRFIHPKAFELKYFA